MSAVLACRVLPGSHTSVRIAEAIKTIIKNEFGGSDGTQGGCTSDGAANARLACTIVAGDLSTPCIAHQLNLELGVRSHFVLSVQ